MSSENQKDYYHDRSKLSNLYSKQWLRTFQFGSWMDKCTPIQPIPPEFDTYHPFTCNVCKRGSLMDVKLLRCSGCNVMHYCSKEHQRHDWKQHKSWCKAFREHKQSSTYIASGKKVKDMESWRQEARKSNSYFAQFCALHTSALQIHSMQPRCCKCFKAGCNSGVQLHVCPRCSGVAICDECVDGIEGGDKNTKLKKWQTFHDSMAHCEEHLQFLCCSGMVVEQGSPLTVSSKKNCRTYFHPKNWFEYFHEKRTHFLPMAMMEMAPVVQFITDGLSIPLTVHQLLPILSPSHYQTREKLVVFVVGAGATEYLAVNTFKEFTRLNPNLKHLEVYLIGPSVTYNNDFNMNESVSTFEGDDKLRTNYNVIKFYKGFYHDFHAESYSQKNSNVPKPDVIVAFNAGITEPSHMVNWMPSLKLMKDMDVPLIVTGYTYLEVEDDTKVLKKLGFDVMVEPSANPFRGLRPFFDPMREVGDFYYSNSNYVCVKGQKKG